MADITYTYSKPRREFGRITDFQIYEPDSLCDIAPSAELHEKYTPADPCETQFHNGAMYSEAQTNTERVHLKSKGMNHSEGGWPLSVDPTEFEERMKYCKKVERDEAYFNTCKTLVDDRVRECLKQNNAIDVYGEYFLDASAAPFGSSESDMGPSPAKVVSVMKDPCDPHRAVASLSWNNDGKRIAVAYSNLRFQENAADTYTDSYIWDVQNPNEPAETIKPSSPFMCVEFYTKDPYLVAAGCHNGTVMYWDTRQPQRPASRSLIQESHRDPVWAVKWLQSKTGELLSVSTDGCAMVWDLRLSEKPLEIHQMEGEEPLTLQPKNNEGGAKGILGGLCLDYDPQVGGPTKYMIGTEQGTILTCNRKGKTQHEKLGTNTFNGHHGPVYAVQRNPFHPKYFLTVGDWTARLWFEDFKFVNMYQTFYNRSCLTYGCWSPVRPAVFFTTGFDGILSCWDLLRHQSIPVLETKVSELALHTIKAAHEGRHLAVGDVGGSVSIVELPPSLSMLFPNEKVVTGRIFENESLRDKNLDKQAKEKRQALAKRHSENEKISEEEIEEEIKSSMSNYLASVVKEEVNEEKKEGDKHAERITRMDEIQGEL